MQHTALGWADPAQGLCSYMIETTHLLYYEFLGQTMVSKINFLYHVSAYYQIGYSHVCDKN